jgi:hypothetical protein
VIVQHAQQALAAKFSAPFFNLILKSWFYV